MLGKYFFFIQCLKPHAGDLAEHELGRHILFLICSGLLPPQSPAQTSQSLLPNLRLSKVMTQIPAYLNYTTNTLLPTHRGSFLVPTFPEVNIWWFIWEKENLSSPLLFFPFFLARLLRMWDLNSPPWNQAHAPCIGSTVLTAGPPGKSLFPFRLWIEVVVKSSKKIQKQRRGDAEESQGPGQWVVWLPGDCFSHILSPS